MLRIPRMRTFIYDDPYHLAKEGYDGRTNGQNRQMIAVTLRLRFAARVNYYGHSRQTSVMQSSIIRAQLCSTLKDTKGF